MHRVLLSKLPVWRALGWSLHSYDRVPSVAEPIAIIEITVDRGTAPPQPEPDA